MTQPDTNTGALSRDGIIDRVMEILKDMTSDWKKSPGSSLRLKDIKQVEILNSLIVILIVALLGILSRKTRIFSGEHIKIVSSFVYLYMSTNLVTTKLALIPMILGKRMRKKFFCILPIYVLLFLFSCSQLSPQIKENLSFKAWTLEKESPRVVAILPFLNQTEEKEIEDLVRKSFYSHFSVKSFSDIEIYKVDETIALMERINSQKFFKIPPQDLGRNLHADALVYGEVIEFTRVFMGIYSQIAVGAKIKIVDATSGKPLWEDFFTTRFHEGDIPLTPLNVPLSAAKSGMNLREVQVIRAIDDLSWNLVKSIPDPAFTKALPKKKERLSWGLQVASFEQVEGAKETLQKFKEKSYQVFLVTVEIQGKLWYRLMMGPFESEEESREWKQKVEKEFNLHPIITEINVTIQESEARI